MTMKKSKRLLSLFLSLLMAVAGLGSIQAEVYAGFEDGDECFACGNYIWDSYRCSECGACSDEGNEKCHANTHCEFCDACFASVGYWCEDSGICADCLEDMFMHCKECDACFCSEGGILNDEGSVCLGCEKCIYCVGDICEECGYCDECRHQEGDAFHCVECDACIQTVQFCDLAEGNSDHCVDCHVICDQCGRCNILDDLDICDTCGLCEECCEENALDAGCDCGDFCVEDSDFADHLCENCGECFDVCEQCEYCGYCLDCCEGNSDCSDGMCIENPDYEEHFCEDCGQCFDDVEQCDSCYDSGELRCRDCCAAICDDMGCDCGDQCFNDPDFEDHLADAHGESLEPIAHSAAVPRVRYSYDNTYHWKNCSYCDKASHITSKAKHTLDANGHCTVCSYYKELPVYITHQPVNVTGKKGVHPQREELFTYKANFSVSAEGVGDLTYQWYNCKPNGTANYKVHNDAAGYGEIGGNSAKMTISVPEDICETTYYYFCEIKDAAGNSVKSDIVSLSGKHNFLKTVVYANTDTSFTLKNGQKCQWRTSNGHQKECICGTTRGRLEKHNFDAGSYVGEDKNNREWLKHTCKDCGYVEYVQKHDHTYETFEIDEAQTTEYAHAVKCTYPDCDHVTYELHDFSPSVVATPFTDTYGAYTLECVDCGYSKNDPNPDHYWTKNNYLGYARYASLDNSIFTKNDTVMLRTNITRLWDKTGRFTNKKITGWKATCFYGTYANTKMDATSYFTFTPLSDGNWTVKLTKALNKEGSKVYFEPTFGTCTHKNSKVINAKAAVCNIPGYTGDTVCADCGKLIKTGNPIAAPSTTHTGTLKLVTGTSRKGSCTMRGYEGTYKCSACGETVKGKLLGYDHGKYTQKTEGYKAATCTEDGYTGDQYCSHCGKLSARGKTIKANHSNTKTINAKEASYTAPGYTGDTYCNVCKQIVKYGYAIPQKKTTTLSSVSINFIPPTYGTNASSVTLLSKTTDYPAYAVTLNNHAWQVYSGGFKEFNGTFQSNVQYYATYAIKQKSGYQITEKTKFYINYKQIEASYVPSLGWIVQYPFKVNEPVKTVSFDFDIPVEGTSASVPPVMKNRSSNITESRFSGTRSSAWYTDDGTGNLTKFNGTFKAGESYTAVIWFSAADSYTFSGASASQRKATVNGQEYSYSAGAGGLNAGYVTVEFTVSDHQWDSGVIYQKATPTQEGETVYTCSVCGTTKIEKTAKTSDGWAQQDGKWYYYKSGTPVTGWQTIGGKRYWFYSNGVMATGWITSGSKKYYFDANGALVTGLKQISGKWYYFNSDGLMQTGWQKVSGKWYYFNTSGVMQTGWQKISGKWYYFNTSGVMQTGWQKISGKWYYFTTSGDMVTGWQKISGKWYYFTTSGDMVTGWQKISGKWYYFTTSGDMVTGWQKISGKWYYFNSGGDMRTTALTQGGKTYYFNSSGVCTNP